MRDTIVAEFHNGHDRLGKSNMKVVQHDAIRLAAAAASLALLLAGCGSGSDDSASSESSSTSSTESSETAAAETTTEEAAPADFTTLLMDAAALDAPVEFIMDEPLLNPNGIPGVAALYHIGDNTAMIGDTIVLAADPAEAATVLANATAALGNSVTGTPTPSPIGTGGVLVEGTTPDASKAVTVLMFTEENAFVTLQFDSAPGDLAPAPPEFVQSTGQLQLDAVKAALPELG